MIMIGRQYFSHFLGLLSHPDKRQRIDALQDMFFLLLNGGLLHPGQWEQLIPMLLPDFTFDDSTLRRWKYQVGSLSANNNKLLVDYCLHNLGAETDTENQSWMAAIISKNVPKHIFHRALSENNHMLTGENIQLATYLFSASPDPLIDVNHILKRSDPLSLMWLASIGAYSKIADYNKRDALINKKTLSALTAETDNDEVLKHVMYAFYLRDSFSVKDILFSPESYTKMGNQQKKWFFSLVWKDQSFFSENIDYFRELTTSKHLFSDINAEVRIGLALGLASQSYSRELSRNILEWYSHEDTPSVIYYLMEYFYKNRNCSSDYKEIVDFQFECGIIAVKQYISVLNVINQHNIGRESKMQKRKRLFISHAAVDKPYVVALVDLLGDLGLTEETVFCSSVPGFGAPHNLEIIEYLREEFQRRDLYVIFVLSENYYRSSVDIAERVYDNAASWL